LISQVHGVGMQVAVVAAVTALREPVMAMQVAAVVQVLLLNIIIIAIQHKVQLTQLPQVVLHPTLYLIQVVVVVLEVIGHLMAAGILDQAQVVPVLSLLDMLADNKRLVEQLVQQVEIQYTHLPL